MRPFASLRQAHTIADDRLDNVSLTEHFRNVTESVREARFARQVARHTARKRAARQAAAEAAAQAAAAAQREAEKKRAAQEAERRASAQGSGPKSKTPAGGSASATQAIQKELAKMMALQMGRGGKGKSSLPAGGFEVDVDEEDLYKWRVKLRPSLFAGSTLEGVRNQLGLPSLAHSSRRIPSKANGPQDLRCLAVDERRSSRGWCI